MLQVTNPTPLARLRPLLEIANLVRDERELEDVLLSIAETVATGIAWRTVVVNLYRAAWDDFQVTTVYGNENARRVLLGTTSTWSDWEPVLSDRFYRHGAYVVRGGEFDWHEIDLPSFTPSARPTQDPDGWDPEDSLIVPLRFDPDCCQSRTKVPWKVPLYCPDHLPERSPAVVCVGATVPCTRSML